MNKIQISYYVHLFTIIIIVCGLAAVGIGMSIADRNVLILFMMIFPSVIIFGPILIFLKAGMDAVSDYEKCK